jgi:hypothetical protein
MKTLLFALLALLAASTASAQTHSFTLTWDPPTIAADKSNAPTGIKIERKVGTAGLYAQVQSLGVVLSTQDSLPNPAPGNFQYCYRARWFNTVGNQIGYSNEVCGFTAAVIVPTVPAPVTGFTLSAISSSAIRMSWQDTNTETGYEVWGKPAKGNEQYAQLTSLVADSVNWDWTRLKRFTTYCAQIRAIGLPANSPFTAPTCATTSK